MRAAIAAIASGAETVRDPRGDCQHRDRCGGDGQSRRKPHHQRPLLSTLSGLNGYPFFVCLPRQQSAPRSLLNLDDFPDHWQAHAIVWRIVQNGPVYHL